MHGMMGIYGALPGFTEVSICTGVKIDLLVPLHPPTCVCVCLAVSVVVCGWIVAWAEVVLSSPSCFMPAEQKREIPCPVDRNDAERSWVVSGHEYSILRMLLARPTSSHKA